MEANTPNQSNLDSAANANDKIINIPQKDSQPANEWIERPELLSDDHKAVPPGVSPSTDKPLVLVPFPDGSLLRYAENPCKAGTYVLVDSVGNQVAVVVNQFVADFLARGAALMLSAMKRAQEEVANPKIITPNKRIITPGA